MRRDAAAGLAAAALLLVSLAACSGTPTSATVTIVSHFLDAHGAAHDLTFSLLDARNEVIAHQKLTSGGSVSFDGVPVGKIELTVDGLCTVDTTLTPAGVTVTLADQSCVAAQTPGP